MLAKMKFTGDYAKLDQLFNARKATINNEVNKTVEKIIQDIIVRQDEAVFEYAKKFDGYEIKEKKDLFVTKEEIEEAVERVGENFIRILERTKAQLIDFHQHQLTQSWSIYKENGVMMGQIVRGLKRVALYVPGGTATYPSTVLMNAIPAQLAGVKELVIITPVKQDGKVSDVILAAAHVCGIETIYKVGGAQAVAAVAYGTPSIKKVDKIVGPGNIYVATAKKCCYGAVDIDMIAGPSEVLVIADDQANPKYIAADLMSQAEHDRLASAILVTTSNSLVEKVEKELEKQLGSLSRQEIIKESLQNYGGVVLVDSILEALEVSNYIAPEHLEILVEQPMNMLPYIENAGSIFLGEYTPEPLGDYMSGTNHVLPTSGTAKFYSALGVYDFVKYSSFSQYPKNILETFKDDVIEFANLEGLDAHANSVKVRFEEE